MTYRVCSGLVFDNIFLNQQIIPWSPVKSLKIPKGIQNSYIEEWQIMQWPKEKKRRRASNYLQNVHKENNRLDKANPTKNSDVPEV